MSRGRFYDVWQLAPGLEDSLLEHIPLGDSGDPAARPACARVRALGRRAAAAGGRLAVAHAPRAARVDLAAAASGSQGQTQPVPGMLGTVYPGSEARFDANITVRRPGRHLVYVRGAFRRELELSVDGRRVATRRHRLSHSGHYEPLGEVDLAQGSHRLEARYRPAELAPGSGGAPLPLGPLYVVEPADPRVDVVPPARAGRLCGKRLDWIESVTR
jgi:hypothetical protein